MKKKSLATLISGLLAVSLTGVGFASWVIIQDAKEEKDLSVSVEEISRKQVDISFQWGTVSQDGKTFTTSDSAPTAFELGHKKIETGWLRNDNDEVGECIKLYFTLDATLDGNLVSSGATIEVVDNEDGGYATAVGAGYITNPTVKLNTATTNDEKDWVIEIAWGDAFGNKNPYDYYNDMNYDTDIVVGEDEDGNDIKMGAHDHANEHLGNLYTCVSGVKFKLTVTGSAN